VSLSLYMARLYSAQMTALLDRDDLSPDDLEAIATARVLFDMHASRAMAVKRGDLVRIEIPLIVGPNGYLAVEVDTAYRQAPVRDARDVAIGFSTDRDYQGTPYVVVAHVPAHKIEAGEVVGEVTPC
jgi:hypothetical protein